MGTPIVQCLIEPAQRQRGALRIALAGVVQHHVQHHANARRMQRLDGGADLAHAAGRQPRIRCHEAHRIVAPGIAEPERRQVPLVDPRRKRHQLDGVDAEPLQVIDDHRLRQRRHGAALFRRNTRVAHGEAAHRHLVDELRPLRRQGARIVRHMTGDRPGHQRRGLDAPLHQFRQVAERPGELRRVGIEQQLRHVEALALLRRPWPFGAQPVMSSRHQPRNKTVMHIAQPLAERQARHLRPAVEQAHEHLARVARHHGNIGAPGHGRDAKGKGCSLQRHAAQVITEGAARPVRCSISAMARDSAMRSASACCVSTPWKPACGS